MIVILWFTSIYYYQVPGTWARQLSALIVVLSNKKAITWWTFTRRLKSKLRGDTSRSAFSLVTSHPCPTVTSYGMFTTSPGRDRFRLTVCSRIFCGMQPEPKYKIREFEWVRRDELPSDRRGSCYPYFTCCVHTAVDLQQYIIHTRSI